MFEMFQDPFILSATASTLALTVSVVYLWFYFKRPMAILLRPFKGIYQKVKTIRINEKTEHFTFGENTYIVNWEKTSYLNKSKPVLFYIEGKTEPVKILSEIREDGLSSKAKLLLRNNAVKQIIEASKPMMLNWGLTILIMCLAIGVGFGIGYIVYPHLNPTQQLLNQTATLPPTVNPPR